MSQEEEKLIEEFQFFVDEFRKLVKVTRIDSSSKDNKKVDVFVGENEIMNLVFKAYRSGKIAGFEVCKELIKPKQDASSYLTHFLNGLGGWNYAAREFKSLIEEEEKKL